MNDERVLIVARKVKEAQVNMLKKVEVLLETQKEADTATAEFNSLYKMLMLEIGVEIVNKEAIKQNGSIGNNELPEGKILAKPE